MILWCETDVTSKQACSTADKIVDVPDTPILGARGRLHRKSTTEGLPRKTVSLSDLQSMKRSPNH